MKGRGRGFEKVGVNGLCGGVGDARVGMAEKGL